MKCHPERSEGSAICMEEQIPRYARDDGQGLSGRLSVSERGGVTQVLRREFAIQLRKPLRGSDIGPASAVTFP